MRPVVFNPFKVTSGELSCQVETRTVIVDGSEGQADAKPSVQILRDGDNGQGPGPSVDMDVV